MPKMAQTTRQWSLIRQWLDDLCQLPGMDVVWLENSLAALLRQSKAAGEDEAI